MPGPIPSGNRRNVTTGANNGAPPLPARRPAAQPSVQKAVPRPAPQPRLAPRSQPPAPPKQWVQAARPRPAPPVSTGPRWGIERFKEFYETQVELAQVQQDGCDAKAAVDTLTKCLRRLQEGCHQFSTDRMLQPFLERLQEWSTDVKNRLTIVQQGGSLSAQDNTVQGIGSQGPNGAPLAQSEIVNAANAEMDAMVEACVPEQKADVKWEDVIGVDEAVQRVREAIELPHVLPQFFASGILQPWRGILLWGPPGTGKTMLAQAAANSVDAKFYCVTASDIVSKWMGQGEKFIKALFRSARQQPSIIFLDEIDSILTQRNGNEHEAMRRIKTQFLQEMEGFSPTHQVTVIAATNVPWEIDDAALRRLEARVWVPLPTFEARAKMFAHKLTSYPNELTGEDYAELARRTEGFSGSDIKVVIKDAALRPVFAAWTCTHVLQREDGKLVPCTPDTPGAIPRPPQAELKDLDFVQDVTLEHLLDAVDQHPPAVDSVALVKYDEYKKRLQANKKED